MNNIGLYVEGRGGIAGQRLCPLSFGLQWQLHFDQDTASWQEDAPHPIPLSTRLGIAHQEETKLHRKRSRVPSTAAAGASQRNASLSAIRSVRNDASELLCVRQRKRCAPSQIRAAGLCASVA